MADVEIDMKGGHAPAQKVGGVRQVVKPRKSESDKVPVKPTAEEIEEFGEDKKEKQSTAVVSGAKTGENEAFPKAAVQSYHEKPQPTHEKNVNMKPNIIQQPRKC
eukprot:TRINITY_DN76376_c0_g1_i1.p1 TRINITY_DN76376_c0_g1~~TRINITY_DN76376_c0_g1_i1.p1  ORF type:complete len:105 (+),score=36.71 TRINITY_DN76376_c0_g1_i1:45-359(+)